MKKLLLGIGGLVLLCGMVAIIYVMAFSSAPVVVLTYKDDPFRDETRMTFSSVLSGYDEFKKTPVKTQFYPGNSTTDDVNWKSFVKARVIVCMLVAGVNSLPDDLPIVMGPIRSSWRKFAEKNPNALFLQSDLNEMPLLFTLSQQLNVGVEHVFFSYIGAGNPNNSPFSVFKDVPQDKYLGAVRDAITELPPQSLLFVACDGITKAEMSDIAKVAAAKRVALCVDRTGYLGCGIMAQYAIDGESAGDALARLTLKIASGAIVRGEVREAANFIKLFSVSVADSLGFRPAKEGFQPLK